MTDEALVNFRRLLLEDLKTDFRYWFLITVAGDVDGEWVQLGGVFIRAHGPTEAWMLMHRLGLYPENGKETCTHGPLGLETSSKIPEDKRWRFLMNEELHSIGK